MTSKRNYFKICFDVLDHNLALFSICVSYLRFPHPRNKITDESTIEIGCISHCSKLPLYLAIVVRVISLRMVIIFSTFVYKLLFRISIY